MEFFQAVRPQEEYWSQQIVIHLPHFPLNQERPWPECRLRAFFASWNSGGSLGKGTQGAHDRTRPHAFSMWTNTGHIFELGIIGSECWSGTTWGQKLWRMLAMSINLHGVPRTIPECT